MLSDTSRDLPSRWREFLSEVDERLPEPVEVHCLGGFVVTMLYRHPRTTSDLDYIEIAPPSAAPRLHEIAGVGSELTKKHGFHFQSAAVADLPESYKERLIEIFPGEFRNLRLFALDPHDLALSKLTRNTAVDREDVAYLAKTVPLDPALLRTLYQREFRPIVMGDPEKHDRTLKIWIESYFPSRT